MPSVLRNILALTGLVQDVPTVTAHGLKLNAVAALPRLIAATSGGYTITADATNVTVTRLAGAADAVDIYVEYWHSYDNAQPLPSGIDSARFPFIIQGGSGGGSSDLPVVEHLAGGGGTSTALTVGADTSFVRNLSGGETTATFTLAAGTYDGQIHNVIRDGGDGISNVTVTPAAFHDGTSLNTAAVNASFALIWNADEDEWHLLSAALGFTVI